MALQEAPLPPKRGKKVSQENITMRVGGMGVQFFSCGKGKKETLVESFLYVNIVGWRYSLQDKELAIEVGVPGGEIERQVVVGTPLGEEIGILMRNHAKSVAKAKRLQDKELAEADEAKLSALIGQYKVENRCTMRAGAELDSAEIDTVLAIGDTIDVTAARRNSKGTVRLQCQHGWLSNKPHLVLKLDENGTPASSLVPLFSSSLSPLFLMHQFVQAANRVCGRTQACQFAPPLPLPRWRPWVAHRRQNPRRYLLRMRSPRNSDF